MESSLIEVLKGTMASVDDPTLRNSFARMLEQMPEISTETLSVASTRRGLRDVRTRLGAGRAAALLAERGVLGSLEETTVMLSLSTLRSVVMSVAESCLQMQSTSPAEILSGLSPVVSENEEDFTIDFQSLTQTEHDDQREAG